MVVPVEDGRLGDGEHVGGRFAMIGRFVWILHYLACATLTSYSMQRSVEVVMYMESWCRGLMGVRGARHASTNT